MEYYKLYTKCKNITDYIHKKIEIKNGIEYFNTPIERYNVQIKILTKELEKCNYELKLMESKFIKENN